MQLAQLVDSIPVVQSTAERGTKFPAPVQDLRVWNKQTKFVERFDTALGWVTEAFIGGSPSQNLGWLNAKDPPFSAVGNNVADDGAALNAAITLGIANGFVLFVPKGDYKTTVPLQIFTFTAGAFASYSRFTMMGEKLPDNTIAGTATMIVPTFNDVPAIMIQNVRAVRLVDIMLLGKNDFSGSVTIANSFSYMMTNSNYVINGCRDSRYSPYAGIAIDPFGTAVPADGGYPGFTAYYVASATGASNLEFERCNVRGFVAGIILSPNGTIANCSEMLFKNCWIEYCKAGFAICQNQSRNIVWVGGSNAWNLYCFDGNSYGSRQGYMPHIFGCNMAGKYLFNVWHRGGAAQNVTGLHAEVFASIGFLGISPVSASRHPFSFRGCEFSFYDFGGIFADHQMITASSVDFTGCLFTTDDAIKKFPLRFWHSDSGGASVTFRSCYIGSLINTLNEMFVAFTTGSGAAGDGSSGVFFDGCTLGDGTPRGPAVGAGALSHRIIEQSAAIIDRSVVPLGATIKFNSAANPGDIHVVGGGQDTISLGALLCTLGANGTATFNAADASIIAVGDLIYSYSAMNFEDQLGAIAFASNQQCLGIVSAINGAAITITGWPQSLAGAVYALRLQWWNRYHQASVGDTHTNTTVDNVTNPGSWKIGNRIKGAGIPAGAYITNVVGSTLTISKAATATAAGVRLFDADVYKVTGTAV